MNAIEKSLPISEESKDKIRKDLDMLSIDEILKGLIKDSDLEEVVACLDTFNAEPGGKRVLLVDKQLYPR